MRRILPILSSLLLLLAALAAPGPAAAQPPPMLRLVQPDPTRTTLSLTETAEVTVRQDELLAVLATESRGASAAAVQAAVNRAMTAALEKARAVPGVVVATGRYDVWRAYGSSTPASQAWQGSQTLVLTTADAAPLLDLVGQVQGQNLAVRELRFRVSRDLLRATQDQASEAALKGLRARAERAARALDLEFERFAHVTLGGDRPREYADMPMAMAARAPDAAPPPVVEAAEQRISATVSAEAVLKAR